jgi:hypothetical protein
MKVMKVLITKPVVVGIREGDEEATHAEPGEIYEMDTRHGTNIVAVEKGIDITKFPADKVKELQEGFAKAKKKAEEAAKAAEKLQTREPQVQNRDPGR